jgi:Mn2+/Fe2+ NRAMP family transporter
MLMLINRRDLMGEFVNTKTFNVVAWVTAVAVIALALVLAYVTIAQPSGLPAGSG